MYKAHVFEGLKVLSGCLMLVLGPHCDDIAIGLGGILLILKRDDSPIGRIGCVFTGGDDPQRRREEEVAADAFGLTALEVLDYPDGQLPAHETAILRHLQRLRDEHKERLALVVVPNKRDRHQDHRAVTECAYRAFRDHLILEYEIQSYDGELFHPNAYVELDEVLVNLKAGLLMECYPSRAAHTWWHRETFTSLARVRGIQANTAYAEAFVARKMIL
jgi:LmbE family N-acetylglucosaminyl deacetylase